MPFTGHGVALPLLAGGQWQGSENELLPDSSHVPVGPFAFPWGCCQDCPFMPQLPRHPADAAARLKGKKNWFRFPTWGYPHCSDLDQGYFTFFANPQSIARVLLSALFWCISPGFFFFFISSLWPSICGPILWPSPNPAGPPCQPG